MDLGWFEVGMNVADIKRSALFYETLGFEVAGGSPEQQFLGLYRNDCSISLYEFGNDPVYLQFYQGDNAALAERVRLAGIAFDRPPAEDEDGRAFLIRDPDGNALFFINQPGYWTKPLVRALGADAYDPSRRQYPPSTRDDLDFGWFQLSLPVADIAASRAFYEKVGFRRLSDTLLQSDDCLVALYGLWLERPQLIFWQGDVDAIERTFTERGLEFRPRFNDAKGTGAMLISPDGHPHYFINQPGVTRPPLLGAAAEPA
jgi:catechol 2,3-dioxygenase-like lactoylglutathione lyase family enzyme